MEAFVYVWYNTKNSMKYIGSHKGTTDDGYTHSSRVMESFTIKTKPPYMKRRILATGTHKEMLKLESELLHKVRHRADYYNVYAFPLDMEASAKGGRNNKGILKSTEHKKKISATLTGKVKSDNTKKKTAKSMMGNTNSKNHNTKKYKRKHSQIMRSLEKKEKLKKHKKKTFEIGRFV